MPDEFVFQILHHFGNFPLKQPHVIQKNIPPGRLCQLCLDGLKKMVETLLVSGVVWYGLHSDMFTLGLDGAPFSCQ